MFREGDRIVLISAPQTDSWYGYIDKKVRYGEMLTIDKIGAGKSYFFKEITVSWYGSYVEKDFITLREYRRQKINRIYESVR